MERLSSPSSRMNGTAVAERSRVLYVDDDEANRRVAQLHLAPKFDLLLASGDLEAASILHREQQRIDVVLMDIELQGSAVDGIALTRWIRGRWNESVARPEHLQPLSRSDIPVLFVTAYGESFSNDLLASSGATGVISKPVNFIRLTLALQELRLEKAIGGFRRMA